MEQHPVPQNISSYEFRLVGDMTLKQFGYLATSALIALFFYSSSLPGYFKWPIILIAGFFGYAFAFMPVEGRPFSQWLTAFTRSTISPTLFTWKKKTLELKILKLKSSSRVLESVPIPPTDRNQLSEYLSTLPATGPKSSAEQKETDSLAQIEALFHTSQLLPTMQRGTQNSLPSSRPIRVRKQRMTITAQVTSSIPASIVPTRPNILAGIVIDGQGNAIPGAILEIRNSQDIPVRALKTNKLGQFQIATPLTAGSFEIETEKDDYRFDIIKIEVTDKIIEPIEIRARP